MQHLKLLVQVKEPIEFKYCLLIQNHPTACLIETLLLVCKYMVTGS